MPPYLGKAIAAARAALPSPTSVCWVFSCFRNPPNSDMDYRIFNRSTCSFLCDAYSHRGWAHRQQASTTFLTWKNSDKFFLCSWRDWTSGLSISSPTLYQLRHPSCRTVGDLHHEVLILPCWLCNMCESNFVRSPKELLYSILCYVKVTE